MYRGLVKAFVFSIIMASVACRFGLKASGGAKGVGIATTSSVVTAITAVIGFDTVFNIVYVVFFP